MPEVKAKLGKNEIYQINTLKNKKIITFKKVKSSWENVLNYKKEDKSKNLFGMRAPQLGALYAIKAHWSVSKLPATVVMPTGTGKTETMIATIISEKCYRTLIVVPSNLLRKQTVAKCVNLGVLREVGVIDNKAINPVVGCIDKTPTDVEELKVLINSCNIIVTTMSMLNRFPVAYIGLLSDMCSELFVDEAHHVAAKTWVRIKQEFRKQRVLQFTATPFRNDGKKIDGKIIYNFPLALAQEQGYFQPINFKEVIEFDDEESDIEIAKAAINQLEEDILNDFKHTILVRASTKRRAQDLYEKIYNKYYSQYKPVLVISGISKSQKNDAMDSINSNESKILVCVDMFGEGIDIPSLKIAAIHDKYQSLPITLQFIGRFARSKTGLGNATIVANVVSEDISEGLKDLYSQDSDWNQLLVRMSSSAIEKEISIQELSNGFGSFGIKDIDILKLSPKVSMIAYQVDTEGWHWKNWVSLFDEDKCRCSVNEEEKVIIIIEMEESKIDWARDKEVNNINYHLHMLYYNTDKKLAYVHSTNKSRSNRFAEAILNSPTRISGEMIFRSLHGINQLMLGTVGLKSAIDGPIRYRMFAGVDIGQGVSESQKNYSTKSNLFGAGYDGNGKTSIGCSYKGTIWSRWVESVDYWMKWCDSIGDKLLNNNIDVNEIFDGTLIPEIINERPPSTPILIEWPDELIINTEDNIKIITNFHEASLYDVDIKLSTNNITDPLRFYVGNELFLEEYELVFDSNKVHYKCIKSIGAKLKLKNKEMSLTDFFDENPPRIRFADQSTLETNLYVKYKDAARVALNPSDIEKWDWTNVDITVESQTEIKKKESIQYAVISKLKEQNDYVIIFDDDGAGEIADVVAVKEKNNEIIIELYHCKFSSNEKPGCRVKDLYEVCGQSQKSVHWKQDGKALVDKMLKRESKRLKRSSVSKFELGDTRKLREVKNKLSLMGFKLHVFIVQPGIDSSNLNEDANELLSCTKTYCLDTYNVKLKVICS